MSLIREVPVRHAITITAILFLSATASATTWHIQPDGSGDAPTIQAGIDSAAVGDTVELACGTYNETDIVMKSGVTVRSATGDPSCVTIDALLLGRIFLFENVDATASIEGLTLPHGKDPSSSPENCGGALVCYASSPAIRDCLFEENKAALDGGAVWCGVGASPRIEGCEFRINQCGRGGGAFYASVNCLPVVIDCLFRGNHASQRGGSISLHEESGAYFQGCVISYSWSGEEGGGVSCVNSDPEFIDCTFAQNNSGADGGAVWVWGGPSTPTFLGCLFEENVSSQDGGGIATEYVTSEILECRFTSNTADSEGGGLFCIRGGSVTMIRLCSFEGNVAQHGGGAYGRYGPGVVEECVFVGNEASDIGGGLMLKGVSSHLVTACVFYENIAVRGGGVAFWEGETAPEFDGCTIATNEAGEGGGLFAKESNPVIGNTIVAFNGPGNAVSCETGGDPVLTCSDLFGNAGGDWVGCVAGQAGTNGNFSSDPLFCDAGYGDYTLAANSPCLDTPGCGLVGALGKGCEGTTSVEKTTWGGIKKMFR